MDESLRKEITMKKIIASPLFKIISFALLFLFASYTTHLGFSLVVPIITNYGRHILTHLPAILACWMPLLSLIFLWLKWRSKNPANEWKICFTYGLLITCLSSILLADHILMTAIEYKWVLHATEATPLFPYDVIVVLAIFLGIGIFTLVRCGLSKEKRLIESVDEEMKTSTKVAVWFYLPFTCYFFGAGLSFVNSFDSYDPNWPIMIPAFLSFFLMTFALVMYIYYKQAKGEDKRKRHFVTLMTTLVVMFVLAAWLVVGLIINPYLFPESLSQYYMLGYAIKIPFGVFICFIGTLAPSIVSLVRYFKRYKIK